MDYETSRPLIQSGDLLAWSHYEWASWYDLQVQAVRIGTQSEYCHVGLAWVVDGRVMVIESVEPVVRVVPLSNLVGRGFYWIPQAAPITADERHFALSKVGTARYSKVQAVQAQLGVLDIGADDLWECAEFWIACRRLSGLDLRAVKATPAAIVQWSLDQGKELRFVAGSLPAKE